MFQIRLLDKTIGMLKRIYGNDVGSSVLNHCRGFEDTLSSIGTHTVPLDQSSRHFLPKSQDYFHQNDMSSETTATAHSCHVLDGMHNDPPTKCWLELLRHGVVFRIDALADDLNDTPLHQQWQALLTDLYAPAMTIQDRIDRWEQLCNVMIETSLPVLQDLAPGVPRDRSLWACFHTPTYHLQLVRDPVSGAVHASVTSGPVDGSPSGCQVAKVGDLDAVAPGLARYALRDVEIVEPDGESSFPPGKVRTPDGVLHGFKACVQDAKRPGTDHVSNHHWDTIRAYLQLHEKSAARRARNSIRLRHRRRGGGRARRSFAPGHTSKRLRI